MIHTAAGNAGIVAIAQQHIVAALSGQDVVARPADDQIGLGISGIIGQIVHKIRMRIQVIEHAFPAAGVPSGCCNGCRQDIPAIQRLAVTRGVRHMVAENDVVARSTVNGVLAGENTRNDNTRIQQGLKVVRAVQYL